jgi:ribosomal protein S18 acetylase RimI-like enzyme
MEETIRTLEQRAFAAWPALRTQHHDGWVLRFADGFTKRANSANALDASREAPETLVANIEAAYAAQGLPPIFRITPLADPAIDATLAARDYRQQDHSLVMTAPTDARCRAPSIQAAPTPHAGWLDAFIATAEAAPQTHAKLAAVLDALVPQASFARIGSAAFGMGVAQDGFVGIFEVLSAPGQRRQGHARRIVEHLMAWGADNGAHTAYLQVVANNAPAIALYRSLGFVPIYGYHYRLPAKKAAVG